MRWKTKKRRQKRLAHIYTYPQYKDAMSFVRGYRCTYTKNIFLWFPMKVNNEVRWLERATVTFKVKTKLNDWGGHDFYFSPIKFK
jgi:hypothetical protein